MAQPTIYTSTGCPHCANLESCLGDLLSKCTVINDNGSTDGTVPATKLSDGTVKDFSHGCDENCQCAAIKADLAAQSTPAAQNSTSAAPASTSTAASSSPAPAWKTAAGVPGTKWSNELSVDWQTQNPKPQLAETPVGYQPPDANLTAVLPIPPSSVTTGIDVIMRDLRTPVKGRKVA